MRKTYIARKKSRASLHCPFRYFYDGMPARGTIWDLSETGWRATGECPLVAGFESTVYLPLPDSGKSINVLVEAAVVRWSAGLNAGWEITRINKKSRARLDDFLKNHNAPDMVAGTKKRKHPK